jgi:hypothetical protein
MILIMIIGVILGGATTLAMIVMLFGTIGFKIYRKIKYGMSIFD